MLGKRPLTERGVRKLSERERTVGLDPEDEAARWLAEHEPTAETPQPAAGRKSKELHRWQQTQSRAARR